jgi:hypothetical protein
MSSAVESQFENTRLRKENEGLKQRLYEIDLVVANNSKILFAFYKAFENCITLNTTTNAVTYTPANYFTNLLETIGAADVDEFVQYVDSVAPFPTELTVPTVP